MVADLQKKQFNYFLSFFKFPFVLYVLGFAIGFYLILTKNVIPQQNLKWIFWVMTLLPYLVIPMRYFFTGYVFGDTKKSIRDNMMESLSMLPVRVFCACGALFLIGSLKPIYDSTGVYIITLGVVLYAVYFLAYFKLSKSEFEISMIK